MDFDFANMKDASMAKDCFNYIINHEISKANRYLYYFSLLSIKLDSNQMINKKDKLYICQHLKKLILGSIRTSDVLGRVNEDKLFVILHQSNPKDLELVCKRINNHVSSFNFDIKGTEQTVSVSIGAACFPTYCNDFSSLVNGCSEMLEKCQKEGGNRYNMLN